MPTESGTRGERSVPQRPHFIHRSAATRISVEVRNTLMTSAFFFLTAVGCSSKSFRALARKV